MGLIYLVQPTKFIGTNIYKVGCSITSSIENPKRLKTYGKRCIIICLYNCDEPLTYEKEIIFRFNICFTLYDGSEYFQGNIDKMEKLFTLIFNKKINNNCYIYKDDNKYINRSLLTYCGGGYSISECNGHKINKGLYKDFDSEYIQFKVIYYNKTDFIIYYYSQKNIYEDKIVSNNLSEYNREYYSKLIKRNIIKEDKKYYYSSVVFLKRFSNIS